MKDATVPGLDALTAAIEQVGARLAVLDITIILVLALIVIAWARNSRLQQGGREGPSLPTDPFDAGKAELLYQADRMGELSEYCETMLTSWPNNIEVHWYRALAAYQTGDYPEAIDGFEKVIELNPGWEEHCGPYVRRLREQTNTGAGEDSVH